MLCRMFHVFERGRQWGALKGWNENGTCVIGDITRGQIPKLLHWSKSKEVKDGLESFLGRLSTWPETRLLPRKRCSREFFKLLLAQTTIKDHVTTKYVELASQWERGGSSLRHNIVVSADKEIKKIMYKYKGRAKSSDKVTSVKICRNSLCFTCEGKPGTSFHTL